METDTKVYFGLMASLDSAQLASLGMGDWQEEGWGERFLLALHRDHTEWVRHIGSVYLMASNLLYRFALENYGPEFGLGLYNRPDAFLRSIIMLLKADQPV